MKHKIILLSAICLLIISSCANKTTINQSEAGDVITSYLKGNPEYKTTKFKFGEMKFNSQSEIDQLGSYKALESEGYVTLVLENQKQKFLSKDSSYVYIIKLTEKAADYVFKQSADEATVRAIIYTLAEDKPINFDQVNTKTAKVTVTLRKENTPFAAFQKDRNENSEFLTKTYKLKLDKVEGWKVVK